MKTFAHLFISIFLFTTSTGCFAQLLVKANNKSISYLGRIAVSSDSASFFWPGSTLKLNFEGTSVQVTMKSKLESGYFYAIIDHNLATAVKFQSNLEKKTISVAKGLSPGAHSLELYKLTNNTSENVLYSIEIDGKAKVLSPDPLPKRKIEFYGNSITAGHGVDRPAGMNDSGAAEHFNNYYTYAALTARHFNAQYSIIARSGIGIVISWFPEIMPEIYDRLNPFDPASKWDFNKYQPDIVVINLFQNDSWLTNRPDHPQFKARFGTTKPSEEFIISAYRNFVSKIREKYPKAQIICALGNMDATGKDSKWPGYIQKAVEQIKDKSIQTVFFPYKNTPGHPTKSEQQAMADQLINFIDKNIKW